MDRGIEGLVLGLAHRYPVLAQHPLQFPKDEFDALPEDVQTAIMEIIPACDEYNWSIMVDSIQTAYDTMEENGMTITLDDDVPAEVFEFLQEAGTSVREDWVAQTGERGQAVLARFEELKSQAG